MEFSSQGFAFGSLIGDRRQFGSFWADERKVKVGPILNFFGLRIYIGPTNVASLENI